MESILKKLFKIKDETKNIAGEETPGSKISELGGVTVEKEKEIAKEGTENLTNEKLSDLVNRTERAKESILNSLRNDESLEMIGALKLYEDIERKKPIKMDGEMYEKSISIYENLYKEKYKRQINTVEAAEAYLEKNLYGPAMKESASQKAFAEKKEKQKKITPQEVLSEAA